MKTRLDALNASFTELKAQVEDLYSRATTEERDLTDEETSEVNELETRAVALKPEIEKEVAKQSDLARMADLFSTAPAPKTRAAKDEIKSVNEYVFHFLRSTVNKDTASFEKMQARSLNVFSSSSSAGSLPYTIFGEVIRFNDSKRRVIDSLQYHSVPDGASFKMLVETGTASVLAQGSENAEIASGYPSLAYVDVAHATYAGGAHITIQAQQFQTPDATQWITSRIADAYAIKTDTVVAAALKAAATTVVPLPVSGATPGTILSALYTAADTVYNASKSEADTLWCSLAVKSWLATRTDSQGQPAFPAINPNNRMGSTDGVGAFNSGLSIAGLNIVVDPNFSGEVMIVGNSEYGHVFESMYPTLSAVQPSTLSFEVALAGKLGTYFKSEGFVKLVDTDGVVGATPNFG